MYILYYSVVLIYQLVKSKFEMKERKLKIEEKNHIDGNLFIKHFYNKLLNNIFP